MVLKKSIIIIIFSTGIILMGCNNSLDSQFKDNVNNKKYSFISDQTRLEWKEIENKTIYNIMNKNNLSESVLEAMSSFNTEVSNLMELTIQDALNYAEDSKNKGFIESMVETRVLSEAYICDINELIPLIENYVSDEILEIVEMTKENLESNVHQFATYLEEGVSKVDRNSIHISEMKSKKARETFLVIEDMIDSYSE